MINLAIAAVGQFLFDGVVSISNEACGLACLMACLIWYKIAGKLTLNDLIRETALVSGSKGLRPAQVAANGMMHGLDARVETLDPADIVAHLKANRPVIVLLKYGDVPRNLVQDKPFTGLHFELAEGVDVNGNILNDDPDQIDTSGKWGTAIPYAPAMLAKAMADSDLPGQCVVIYGLLNLDPDHAATIDMPIGLNVHVAPDGEIVGGVPDKSPVWVIKGGPVQGKTHFWSLIQYQDGDFLRVGWVVADYLSEPSVPVRTVPVGPAHTNTPGSVLNVHRAAGKSAARAMQLADKTNVVIAPSDPVAADDLTWVEIAQGWVDQEYLSPGSIDPILPSLDRTVPVGPAHTNTPDDALNVHSAAGKSATRVAQLADKTNVTVAPDDLVEADSLVWAKIEQGWVDQEYLAAGSIAAAAPRNFVGWFVFPDVPEAFFGTLDRLAKAGRPVPIVTVLQDDAIADRIKTTSPETVVIFRYENGNPTPSTSAQAWWDHLWPNLSRSHKCDYYEFCNEGMEDGAAFVRFYNDLMDIAAHHGIHITVADLAMGNGNAADIAQLLGRIEKEGHVLNYHQYDQNSAAGDASMYVDEQDLVIRWLPWLQNATGAYVAGGEAGTGNAKFLGVPWLIARMKEFNAIMAPLARFIKGGGSWWCLGGHTDFGWDQSSCDVALGAYEAYLMSFPAVA
jgi:hypothetical protein